MTPLNTTPSPPTVNTASLFDKPVECVCYLRRVVWLMARHAINGTFQPMRSINPGCELSGTVMDTGGNLQVGIPVITDPKTATKLGVIS